MKSYSTNLSIKNKELWKEVGMIKGSITNSKCIDGHSNPHDVVNNLYSKFRTVLINSDSHTNLVLLVPALNNTTIIFFSKIRSQCYYATEKRC